jgi:hypothetical protein
MGTSDIAFRGRSFSASDAVLDVWFKLLVDEIDAVAERPAWLSEVREDWYVQATEEFGFGHVPDLDAYLTDSSRVALLSQLARQANQRLQGLGDPIPMHTLNALGAGKSGFLGDVPAELFRDAARAFIALLEDA